MDPAEKKTEGRQRPARPWARLSIPYKLGLLVGLLVLALGLLIYAALRQSAEISQAAYQQETFYYNINGFQTALAAADEALQRYLQSPEQEQAAAADWDEGARQMRVLLDRLKQQPDPENLEFYFLTRALQNGYDGYTGRCEALLAMRQQGAEPPAMYAAYAEVAKAGGYLSQTAMDLQTRALSAGQKNLAELRAETDRKTRYLWVLLTATVLLFVWMLREILRSIVVPVLRLAEASKVISEGEFDTPDVEVQNRDEIYTLAQAFNHMKHSMKRLFTAMQEKQEMEQRLHQKELEASESRRLFEQAKMQQLNSQVNPHFLFNTLNIISRTAQRERAPDTQHLILSLARLFRYSLRTDDSEVPLQREIKIVDDYMTIQRTRFESRVGLYWRIAPRLCPETLLVPPFLLQPLVENAVIHGLEPKREGGVIRIRAHWQGGALHLIISDNGVGMSRETLRALLSQQAVRGDVSGIGMGNVRSRLQMAYPQAQFRITSRQGRGTCVHLVLPGPHRTAAGGGPFAQFSGMPTPGAALRQELLQKGGTPDAEK